MNDDAKLYANSNNYQRTVTKKVLDEFAHWLQIRKDGKDSILDVGCGSGDVTVDLVVPLFPPQFQRLIGCDLSQNMVEYAQQKNRHPKVRFEKLDIRDDVAEFITEHGTFDHVVSFYCLHWVNDLQEVFTNIRKLLKPGGDCLLMFLTSANVFTVYDDMAKSEKWSKYMQDVNLYITPHQYGGDPVGDFQQILQTIGFTCSSVEAVEASYDCESSEEFRGILILINFQDLQHNRFYYADLYRSVNPFIKRVPDNEQENFVNELTERLTTLLTIKYKEKNYKTKYVVRDEVIVIYARN